MAEMGSESLIRPAAPLPRLDEHATSIAIDQLNERHKACLRLVGKGMTSKEIAQNTGLSPSSVDTYIKHAMARLGASNRREAARMFGHFEASQKLGSPSEPVAPLPAMPAQPSVSEPPERRNLLQLPPLGGTVNDLSALQKSARIIQVVIVGTTVALAVILLIAGVLKVVR
ncbi:helix-turn-helix domain-containing protein [Sphingomonas sp. RS6]